ncbi:indolepyruvate ferredoxin oxidoreductase family protein [Hoeflea sp. EC-HK425]|uniref:indolepyruvate ferredoxin oxidoreductase family protein n=1 Tax=Hoeflea sp. EC-HK425 TaxID=2038388 RepID=UPI0012574B2B|nr:indolepyruvate ferredoxin oxidoreductase family protein [Hoeflea sp. EC-HK425]VVT17524.1 Indolepyruvate ferredoxin oxidoreductase, alpha and beta subunit [Hoeflea sp. EC-HK425]
MTFHTPAPSNYTLNDRYALASGRVFMTGTQALVRALFDQARRDREAGLKTGGFVSGYRGSPLGGLDMELWRQKARLEKGGIEFLPAVNEDLAATAVLGSQQVETNPNRQVEGVFGLWYGKGPGVDRAGDALKHGNAYGSSPHGGVLVVAGDDHGCVSSSMPHQSDVAFMAWFMPTLNPASVAEYLEFAEYGYALSRYSGMWVGFKAISETVEGASSFLLKPDRVFAEPDFQIPATGLHYRWPDLPGPQIEERMEAKKHAVFAFADANPVDRAVYGIKDARFGFVTTGKAHLDLMEALRLLGLDEARCRALGIDIYKVGMVWPLARRAALDFVREKREVVVIEEKRGIIESQFKEYFYDWPGDKPQRMVGKHDETGCRLIPWTGELSPRQLVPLIAKRLDGVFRGENFAARAAEITGKPVVALSDPGATRTPYFCSGCPHNTSTKVPEGSKALAGIGCHFMASWMDRETSSLIQMGGEGVNWAASSRFTGKDHIFQNLGEGTWYHSGSMAIRQAIAAKANITYKILYNDAVAMTGGQPVDGPVSVQAIAHICRAEGVERIALVSDDPDKFSAADFPGGISIHARAEMDAVQRELREVPGVSVLIYEQTCATEKRRRRKRGELPDPKTFAVINELVCEGCGDCSTESNCLSIEPKETEFGRKRQINQSNCNKDMSCLNGFCPSFVTIEGAERRKPKPADLDIEKLMQTVTLPALPGLDAPFNLLVTGVGGTGVVTVGQLISMAAHLEGKGASILDFTGFAQKFGAVLSFVRIGRDPDAINQVRIDTGMADAVIGCDVVVSSSPKASGTYRAGTSVALNLASMPTGDLVLRRDADLNIDSRASAIAAVVGADNLAAFDANLASEALFGDAVYANVMMLGFAWQRGLVPVTLDALMRAIELNNVAIDANKRALACGRLMASDPSALAAHLNPKPDFATSPENIIARRAVFLEGYQNRAWADRYRSRMTGFEARMPAELGAGLTSAAAKSLFKLMSYKDEYEVARLHQDSAFRRSLEDRFEGEFRVVHHFAPPLLAGGKDARGRPLKRAFGPAIRPALSMLARLKGLRGTALDPFGYTAERKMERGLIAWFETLMARCEREITPETAETWCQVLSAPMDIRGYGPVKHAAVDTVKARVEALLPR